MFTKIRPHPIKIDMRFSHNVEICLRNAGWVPFRNEIINEKILSSYPPSHPAYAILREFGELRILPSSNYVNEDYGGIVDIFGYSKFTSMLSDLSNVEKVLNKNLAFIGYVDQMEAIFMTDDQGVLVADGNLLHYWAPNFDDFLERILTGTRRARFPLKYVPGSWER